MKYKVKCDLCGHTRIVNENMALETHCTECEQNGEVRIMVIQHEDTNYTVGELTVDEEISPMMDDNGEDGRYWN